MGAPSLILVAVVFGVLFVALFHGFYPLVDLDSGIYALCGIAACLAALALRAGLGYRRRDPPKSAPKP